MSARIASEVSLWVCHLFRFTNGAAFCHDDTREGLVKITRMALHQHYPKMCQDGFEALFSRPPVIYLTSNTYVDIAHYVCMQLGLPLSTVSLTYSTIITFVFFFSLMNCINIYGQKSRFIEGFSTRITFVIFFLLHGVS